MGQSRLKLIGTITALTFIYVVAGKLGLSLAFAHPSASVVWPPTGIALAMILVLGFRVCPSVFLGAFLVNITTVGTVMTSLGIATGNTLECLVGASLVKYLMRDRHTFDHPQNVLKFVGFAGIASTMISATFGVTSLTLGGVVNGSDYGSMWLTWWLGDVIGALIVAPPLILWAENPRLSWTKAQSIELAGLAVTLVIVSQIVFDGLLHATAENYPLSFLCMPIQVWAALRFGPRETATVTVVFAATAAWGTLQGFGPFVLATPHESLIVMQIFIGTTSVLALVFAAVVAERQRVEQGRELLIQQLSEALGELRTLRGLLPICAGCKKIREPDGDWETIEVYIEQRSQAQFTHSMCPECFDRLSVERHH